MTEQQRTAFDQWFDSELDPELNLTPGDKELCRHAWQHALEWAAKHGGAPTAPQVAVPEGWTDRHTRITRFALWRLINEGYHRARAAAQKGQPGTADDADALLDDVERAEEARGMLAVPTAPAPTKGEEIHVNVDGVSVYTLPLEPTGMAAPRFVVHVPAPDEREIADWLSREIGFANAYADKHKVSPNPEARAIMIGRAQALQEVRDKLSTRLRAGKERE